MFVLLDVARHSVWTDDEEEEEEEEGEEESSGILRTNSRCYLTKLGF
jgi:hypothetical protein